jgi:hypothetical protein
MHSNGDQRDNSRENDGERYDPLGFRRAAFWGRALKVVIALIAMAAVAASVPALSRADFPVASLLIYVIGMGFVTMPLLLFHEYLLKTHQQRVAHARQAPG